MAHFYASIQGNRGEATRMGSKDSGIDGHVRGWGVGIKSRCFVDHNGVDCCEVWLTSGSNTTFHDKFIGVFTREDLG